MVFLTTTLFFYRIRRLKRKTRKAGWDKVAEVITKTGLPVYGPASLAKCKRYIAQALAKGSKPGFLSISEVTRHDA